MESKDELCINRDIDKNIYRGQNLNEKCDQLRKKFNKFDQKDQGEDDEDLEIQGNINLDLIDKPCQYYQGLVELNKRFPRKV